MDFKVYINSNEPQSPQVMKLRKKLNKFEPLIVTSKSTDWENWLSCVNNCPRDKFCFWIKDDSVTTANAEQIYEYLTERINENWDLLYLCKWLDRCDQYVEYQQGNTSYLTVKSPYPNGIQALVVSPMGKSKIQKLNLTDEAELLQKIKEEKLIAYSSVPNIFEISGDISGDTFGNNIMKHFHCQTVYPNIKPDITENQVVSNLIKEINQITPAKPTLPEEPVKPLTEKLANINPRFFTNILLLIYVIFFVVILVNTLKNLFYGKKKNSQQNVFAY